ncbi:hypothetical protein BOX15_Mlig031610g1 [Macrostomum lignano]|uniref:Golgi apparatus protein 1 n=1 Tax=Macrostomum lignano TaxID=282301 RepID=A0A267FUC8_9PLAT|nr:hypothetical protein BOX15_Mlig031610g1 [Macrostomum lignano]
MIFVSFLVFLTITAVFGQGQPDPVDALLAMPQAKVSKQPAQREATAAAPTFLPPLHHRQKSLAVREFLGRSRGSQPLYKQPACRDSVRLHCSQAVRRNNFAVLACLQRSQAVAESLPEACQAAIWQLKFNLTHNVDFATAASGACQEDLRRIKACGREPPRSVLRISCLIEHRANVSERACRSYLRRLEPLVFADYRLVERFIGACKADVVRTGCGRLEPRTNAVSASLPTSQGRTVACLGQKVAVVSHQCRLQLLRLAELQTSDYHNDRPLFYACRDDRERLCGAVSSGGGRVLACLNRQREAARPACQVELARVRGLAALDFAVYRRFADACGADLHRLGCVAPGGEPAGSAAALLCLESSLISKGTTAVTAACQTRMMDVRSDFISDPQLLPGLASGCSRELQRCRADHTAEQGLLHCIMRQLRAARDAQLTDGPGRNSTSVCERAVDRVLRVAMPTRDLRVDPVVMSGCAGEVRLHCSAPGTASVYTCLKSRLAAQPETVSVACSNRLAELVYFENRDFRLNARLFKACRAVAAARCGAGETWWSGARDKAAAVALGATFNCLYGLMIRNETSVACSAQLAKSLRERADRARLDARLFAPCLRDLSRLCLHSKRPGDEFTCLQDNLSLLDRTCARVVRQVSERVDSDIELSPDLLFVHSCQPFVRKFCDRVQGQVGLDKTVMSCLIQLKAHPKMDPRCRAGVEHHQLVSLRDYHISRDFASACGDDIRRLCSAAEGADAAGEPSSRRNIDKTVVVRCLATAARDDVLKSRPQRLSRKCQGQLSLELLQRHRLPSLDPRLAKSCELELRTLCPPGKDGGRRLACLRAAAASDATKVSADCRAAIFKQDKVVLNVPVLDARLMASCQRMIARHCSDRVSRPVQLYTCLRSRMHHASFDAGCFAVVNERMQMQQADYRLNPELQRYCGQDIDRHCRKQKEAADKRDAAAPDPSNQGAVTRCLRDIVASEDDADQAAAVGRPAPPSKSSVLRGQCRSYLRSLALEFNLNYRLDPRLSAACGQVAESYCHAELEDVRDSGSSLFRVTECLKRLLSQGRIRSQACSGEVRRLLHESDADIHVDPLLYRACTSEIAHLCGSVPLGAGRQMRCTVAAFRDLATRQLIGSECARALDQRLRLMEAAAGVLRPRSVGELAVHINESPARAYFIGLGLSLLVLLLLVGFCSGRASSRRAASAKRV